MTLIDEGALAKLKNKTFTIGTAHFKIIRTAPPCGYIARLLGEDMMKGLKYISGYRAKILKSSTISVNDKIIIEET